ncbi:alpha/beta hydrolase family protein [Inquilinus sp. CA228]|uniref:alpha/beta hydrolase family protein n=1 Tax=Inquilinus sp. CA228 TaxID=3455609 RepID=UPI003F8D3B4C
MAEDNRIDLVRPDAPQLAARGAFAIGVRTIDLVHPDQPDIVHVEAGKPIPHYDRKLTVEIWYPAEIPAGAEGGDYTGVFLRDGETRVTLHGTALRDAAPKTPAAAGYPLVIISHGYPGNRFLLSPLAENLATKGYVVASIDHTDSTYSDQGKFGSTLVNRPLDQKFVLDEMARLSGESGHFLAGLVDASNAAVIGYSMGGYGAVITAGGGVTRAATELESGAPAGTLAIHLAGSASHEKLIDPRIKAVVALAPWGMERGYWDAAGLAGVRKPIFFVAGSVDDVSGYETGVKKIFEQSVHADRYLLTFANANHNAAAPMPAPAESWAMSAKLGFAPFDHYADPVWDTVRMNNILQHFVTAFLGKELKGDTSMDAYLSLVENSGDGVWAANADGSFKPEHTYWRGFRKRTAAGLSLIHLDPAARP